MRTWLLDWRNVLRKGITTRAAAFISGTSFGDGAGIGVTCTGGGAI